MSWSITNGDGTIAYQGMTEARARESAQQHADKHGEVFFVAEAGREYPEAAPHLGLGEPVSPAADATEDWIPTHRITWRSASGPHVVWDVMCDASSEDDGDGPAYTREDWDRGDNASWGVVNGEWLCEGQATPGGANGEVVVEEISDDSPRVMDANTGDVLDGRPSRELVAASLAVPHTGAVGARRDSEGAWQLVRPEDARPDTRTVWIQE